jgi:hypothetical protein
MAVSERWSIVSVEPATSSSGGPWLGRELELGWEVDGGPDDEAGATKRGEDVYS